MFFSLSPFLFLKSTLENTQKNNRLSLCPLPGTMWPPAHKSSAGYLLVKIKITQNAQDRSKTHSLPMNLELDKGREGKTFLFINTLC